MIPQLDLARELEPRVFRNLRLEFTDDFKKSRRVNISSSWDASRGLERVLLQETRVSDLLQFLSDLDARP